MKSKVLILMTIMALGASSVQPLKTKHLEKMQNASTAVVVLSTIMEAVNGDSLEGKDLQTVQEVANVMNHSLSAALESEHDVMKFQRVLEAVVGTKGNLFSSSWDKSDRKNVSFALLTAIAKEIVSDRIGSTVASELSEDEQRLHRKALSLLSVTLAQTVIDFVSDMAYDKCMGNEDALELKDRAKNHGIRFIQNVSIGALYEIVGELIFHSTKEDAKISSKNLIALRAN